MSRCYYLLLVIIWVRDSGHRRVCWKLTLFRIQGFGRNYGTIVANVGQENYYSQMPKSLVKSIMKVYCIFKSEIFTNDIYIKSLEQILKA